MPVREDILKYLQFKKPCVFTKSFERKNLSYLVYDDANKIQRLAKICTSVKGSIVVYARNRRKTKEVADWLNLKGISATYYHAGLTQSQRSERQQQWMANRVQVIAATNAFGMGIDKPDVRVVVHVDMPESLEGYYQEAGRAGRDEKNAFAVLLYSKSDRTELERIFEITFPEIKIIKNVYNALGNYLTVAIGSGENVSFGFDIAAFANAYNFNVITALSSLKILADDGYLALTDAVFIPSRLKFMVGQMDLYKFQVENAHADKFIKTVLRSYGGVFDNFVKINEQDISLKMNIGIGEVEKMLHYLQMHGLIEYIPQTDKPQLTFLTPRLKNEDVQLDAKVLEQRKRRFISRAMAMLNFAESKTACRNLILLSYFGETATQRCGTCDYCRQRNKMDLNDMEFETIRSKMKELITGGSETVESLLAKFPPAALQNTGNALQWLFDTGFIEKNENNILVWNE